MEKAPGGEGAAVSGGYMPLTGGNGMLKVVQVALACSVPVLAVASEFLLPAA